MYKKVFGFMFQTENYTTNYWPLLELNSISLVYCIFLKVFYLFSPTSLTVYDFEIYWLIKSLKDKYMIFKKQKRKIDILISTFY